MGREGTGTTGIVSQFSDLDLLISVDGHSQLSFAVEGPATHVSLLEWTAPFIYNILLPGRLLSFPPYIFLLPVQKAGKSP